VHVTVPVAVDWGDCDPAGIVFYPRFFAWMDKASHVIAREMGIPREAMLPPEGDSGFPIVGANAQFLASATMDDRLEVRTWVVRVGRTSLRFRHEISRIAEGEGGEVLLVRGHEDRVYVKRDATGAFRPAELTPGMRETLARYADPRGEMAPETRPGR
jgi:4-hydroxybenzoyl-CoA thioesterase